MTTTLSSANSGDSVVGSLANVSIAAPPSRPSAIAAASASSSTMPPRPALISRMPGLACASTAALTSPTVSGVFVAWIETKSADRDELFDRRHELPRRAGGRDRRSRTGRTRRGACRTRARAARRAHRRDRGRRCRASCRGARRLPTSSGSTRRPSGRRCACGTLRACASSNASVCSAAERMFDCGAFTTITPRRVASATSTLSSPMPARPTTTRSAPGFEHLGGDLRRAADHERLRALDRVEQLLGRQARSARRRRGRRRAWPRARARRGVRRRERAAAIGREGRRLARAGRRSGAHLRRGRRRRARTTGGRTRARRTPRRERSRPWRRRAAARTARASSAACGPPISRPSTPSNDGKQ